MDQNPYRNPYAGWTQEQLRQLQLQQQQQRVQQGYPPMQQQQTFYGQPQLSYASAAMTRPAYVQVSARPPMPQRPQAVAPQAPPSTTTTSWPDSLKYVP